MPPKSSSSARTYGLTLRLTRGELAILRGRARTAGAPLSTHLRRRALAHRVRVQPGRIAPSDLEQLIRLGTRLNAVAHAANASRRIVNVDELVRLLGEIRQLLRRVRQRLGT